MHHVSGTVYHMIIIFGHLCKMIIFLVDFFHFLKILIFRIFRGEKGEKIAQNDKRFFLSHSLSQEPYIIWLSFMVHMCKMIISPGVFFHFFKILILWVLTGVKGQKMIQNYKKICLLHPISQERYIILSFMVHMCKSPGVFFIFSQFWLFGLLVGQKGKKWSKMKKKNSARHAWYFRNHASYDCHLWHTCVKW